MKRLRFFRLMKEAMRCQIAALWPGALRILGLSPLMAHLWLTSDCSGRCKTCTQWHNAEEYTPSTDELKALIKALRDAGVEDLYFMGGDILLRADALELMRFGADMGFRTHTTLNAYSVTGELAGQLMRAGLTSLHLSLDMLGSELDEIRGVGNAANKVVDAFHMLSRGNSRTQIGISATIMKDTLGSMKQVVSFAIEHNLPIVFNLINFTHYFFATDYSRDQYSLTREEKRGLQEFLDWVAEIRCAHPRLLPRPVELEWIGRYFDDYRQKRLPCFQTLLKICVRENGDVRPCCSMESAGNLFRQRAKDILRSDRYLAVVRRALLKECPGCSCRYPLNLAFSVPAHVRDLVLRLAPGKRTTAGDANAR